MTVRSAVGYGQVLNLVGNHDDPATKRSPHLLRQFDLARVRRRSGVEDCGIEAQSVGEQLIEPRGIGGPIEPAMGRGGEAQQCIVGMRVWGNDQHAGEMVQCLLLAPPHAVTLFRRKPSDATRSPGPGLRPSLTKINGRKGRPPSYSGAGDFSRKAPELIERSRSIGTKSVVAAYRTLRHERASPSGFRQSGSRR